MKKMMTILGLFILVKGTSQQVAADLEILKKLNATFIHNFVTNDTVSHSRIIHQDFVCISGTGKFINREDYLKDWLHGFDGFIYWDYRNERIDIYGNTALVRAQNKYVMIKDGKEISGVAMYTDTYIKENGEWKCVQAQIGRVSPENVAGDETIVRQYDYRNKK